MKVILLEDVKTLGKKGQIVDVSDGYARNCILPKKLGVEATNANLNDLKLQKAREAKLAQEQLEAAQALKAQFEGMTFVTSIKTGEGGKVFGSVSTKEICKAAKDQYNVELDKKKIMLDEPIRHAGFAEVPIKLHPQVVATLKIQIKEEA